MRADLQAAAGEGSPQGQGDDQPGQNAQHDADRGGHQVVGGAFEDEHLHQVAALGTHGTRHAHFGLALGSQHDEDQENQHQPGGDAEQAGNDEDGGEGAGTLLADIQGVALDVVDAQLGLIGE